MSRSEQAVFTNMCMVYDGDYILVLDRRDPGWPGITFPGGHVKLGESFVESVKREVLEETGLSIENPILCGIKQFQNRENQRYVVLLFKTNQFSGRLQPSDEGDVFWVRKEDLDRYQLVPDFWDTFQVFESDELSELYYFENEGDFDKKLL